MFAQAKANAKPAADKKAKKNAKPEFDMAGLEDLAQVQALRKALEA